MMKGKKQRQIRALHRGKVARYNAAALRLKRILNDVFWGDHVITR
jgi:hypothetical protein